MTTSFNCKIVLALLIALSGLTVAAQDPLSLSTGERLTYHMSFDRFENVGFAELQVASAGKLDGREVIELRSKFKTLDLVSATFFLIDQSRTTFVSPDTGLPVYITKITNDGPLPKETTLNFLRSPAFGYDLTAMIYRARLNGGAGTYPLYENGKQYTVTFDPGKTEHLRVDAGEFDTVATEIRSDFFTAHGIKDVVINFSSDPTATPVRMTFRLRAGGVFRIALASMTRPEAGSVIITSPTPAPAATPTPVPTPKATPTPLPYVENRPLSSELNFAIGESLDYRVTAAGLPAGIITLSVKDRKQVSGEDTLALSAVVTAAEPGNNLLTPGDHIEARVDPETLAPRSVESRFNSSIAGLNQNVVFNKNGQVAVIGATPVDSPLGTHTLLSLIYAMRSFNLTSTSDPSAPVNDTRVAVFWAGRTLVFSLRPGKLESIILNGQKVLAQPISITTNDPQLDALAPKVWLAADTRVPLRFTAGALQADLIKK